MQRIPMGRRWVLPLCLQPVLARCLVVCLGIGLVLHGHHCYQVWRSEPLPSHLPSYRVDINRANWEELIQLPRIGETMARRIVADREARGPFATPEALTRVRGIGLTTVERIEPYLASAPGASRYASSTQTKPSPSAVLGRQSSIAPTFDSPSDPTRRHK